jgi:hypothetical protein
VKNPVDLIAQWKYRSPWLTDWTEEVVATCTVCGKPVRRNQPRKLIGGDEVGGQTGPERINEDLVHFEC